MRLFVIGFFVLVSAMNAVFCQPVAADNGLNFYNAQNPLIQYAGRIDFSNPLAPRFWSPGVYLRARFKGTRCEVQLNDEAQAAEMHNWITIVIDNKAPKRIKLAAVKNRIKVADSLADRVHTVLICKATESAVGYLDFAGIWCKALLPLTEKPLHKIEFIGNSITCGLGNDMTIPCGQGQWFDQHNAYMAYGPVTARALNADWQLTSVSGIGLVRSCCGQPMIMPVVFDKVNLRDNLIPWTFKNYQPDVVTVCLGQNDGIIDSALFCSAYVTFIKRLRGYYPNATLVCLTSPMAYGALDDQQKRYISGVLGAMHATGENNLYSYHFAKTYIGGCSNHPSLTEHQLIADELTAYLRKLKKWD
jgi:hypothetical protein